MRLVTPRAGCALSILLLLAPAAVSAQPVDAVLLVPEVSEPALAPLARAFDRVLRARIDAHEAARLGPTPALGIEDLRLAVGCVAPSDECNAAVARQVGASVLLMPSVERAGDELVLTLSVLTVSARPVSVRTPPGPEAGARSRSVVRRARAEGEALDAIDPMVREAFGLPESPELPESSEASEAEVSEAAPRAARSAPPRDADAGALAGAAIVLGVGVVATSLGVALGVAADESLGAYQRASVGTQAEVDAALAHLERASSEATAANALVPIGAALALGGAAWLLVELLLDRSPGDTVVAPLASPSSVGLVVVGSFGGAR